VAIIAAKNSGPRISSQTVTPAGKRMSYGMLAINRKALALKKPIETIKVGKKR
jgi:hypothetical protein